jgi:hypothetical protein
VANELQAHYTPGLFVYAVLRRADGQFFNGAGFEMPLGGNWGNYAISAPEQGGVGYYYASMPAGLPAGQYNADFFWRQGTTPAVLDTIIGQASLSWSGSADDSSAQIADRFLGRALQGGADGGRTVRDSLRAGRNKVAFDVPAVGQFTVYDEGDVNPAWTGTYTRGQGGLGPLVTTDPA